MSLFSRESIQPLDVHYQTRTPPVNKISGQTYLDGVQKALTFVLDGPTVTTNKVCVAATAVPVTVTPNGQSNLISVPLGANLLNVVGKTLHVYGSGIYNTNAGQTPTFALALTFANGTGQTNLFSMISGNTTAGKTNFPWSFEGRVTTQTAGTSGALEPHGVFRVTLGGSNTAATSVYLDIISATVSLDVTQAWNVVPTAIFSTNDAANIVTMRQMVVEIEN